MKLWKYDEELKSIVLHSKDKEDKGKWEATLLSYLHFVRPEDNGLILKTIEYILEEECNGYYYVRSKAWRKMFPNTTNSMLPHYDFKMATIQLRTEKRPPRMTY